jgi:phosphinothricin acetyltransferase
MIKENSVSLQAKPLTEQNFSHVKKIYEEGIQTGNATFQASAPDWQEWDREHLPYSRIGAYAGSELVGWAALTPVSGRCVYAGVGEVSVYVGRAHQGQGIGQFLLQELVNSSEKNGLWTLQAGIFPENKASIKLHLSAGFRIIGTREKIGQMNGIWRDTVLLERRSIIVG